MLAPLAETGDGVAMVWNERPTVVWQGVLEWIKLYPAGETAPEQGLSLPSQTTASLHTLTVETALQAGVTYNLVVEGKGLAESPPLRFRIIPDPEREQIATDLQTLAAQGGSAEAIAVRQADYFAERQLWADFWQTVTALQNPSQSFKDEVQSSVDLFCPSEPTSRPTPAETSASQFAVLYRWFRRSGLG